MSAMAPISADFMTPCSSSSSSSTSDPASNELRNSNDSPAAAPAPTANSIASGNMVASVTKGAHEAAPGALRVAPKLSPNGTSHSAAKMPEGSKPAPRAIRMQALKRKRKNRWRKYSNDYKDCMTELFYLQSNQALQDLPAFRKKPSVQFINFLKSNNAPAEILRETQIAVGVPATATTSAPSTPAVTVAACSASVAAPTSTTATSSCSNSTGTRTTGFKSQVALTSLTSGATPVLAAAAAQHQTPARAAVGTQNRVLKVASSGSAATSLSSSSVQSSNPYVFTDAGSTRKIEPLRRATPSTPSVFSRQESVPSTSRQTPALSQAQNLAAQPLLMQEPAVTARVRELIKEGVWSQKRIPKVCERPRPKTHWDFLLNEVQWLAVDFYQERSWKKAAAKMLAHSAKEFVEGWEERKRRARAAQERQQRQKAALVASEILRFWEGVSEMAGKPKSASEEEQASESRLVHNTTDEAVTVGINGIADSDDDVSVEDDESTISEQERFEMSGTQPHVSSAADEIKALVDESVQPLDSLRVPEHFEVVSNHNAEDENSESDSDVSESADETSDSDDDSDDCDYSPDFYNELLDASTEAKEKVVSLPLLPMQRVLYDECLSEDRNQRALANGEIHDVARVLTQLRRICNHPQLLKPSDDVSSSPKDVTFPRVPDLALTAYPRLTSALDFDPFADIDLNSYNMVFLTHETSGLTAISVDRIRRVCAPRKLIEELPAQPANPRPSVPQGRFALGFTQNFPPSGPTAPRNLSRSLSVNSTQLPWDNASKSADSRSPKAEKQSRAFHPESLSVIARFNERRCRGMPLYGQDLICSLTVVESAKPTRGQRRVNGWSSCLSALAERRRDSETRGTKRRSYGEFKYKTSALERLCRDVQNTLIGDTDCGREGVDPAKEALIVRLFSSPIRLVPGYSRTVNKLEARISPALCQLSRDYQVPVQVPAHKAANCVSADLALTVNQRLSIKLQHLDILLGQIRSRHEKVLVLVEMEDMLALLRQYFQSKHFPFVYLDPSANKCTRQRQMARFVKRTENVCLLASATASCRGVAELLTSNVSNVVFYDSSPCLAPKEASRWVRILKRSSRSTLTLYRLVCEGSVESNLARKALQERLLIDLRKSPENGFMWKVKKDTLDDLLKFAENPSDSLPESVYIPGARAEKIFSVFAVEEDEKPRVPGSLLPISPLRTQVRKDGDLEALVHLNWLWNDARGDPIKLFKELEETDSSLRGEEDTNGVLGPGPRKLNAIERYGIKCIDDLPTTPVDIMVIKDDLELEAEKQAWEDKFSAALAKLTDEIEYLDSLPCLTYSSEDAGKSWHAQDGKPMEMWAAPTPPVLSASLETELMDHYLSLVYKRELMTDDELPPVFFKKEGAHLMLNAGGSGNALAGGSSIAAMGGIGMVTVGGIKRSASDAGLSPQLGSADANYEIRPKLKREDGSSGIVPPRSLFDRPANLQIKMRREKMPNFKQRPPSTVGAPGAAPSGAGQPPPSIASLRHPLPKPQVDAENAPEWLIQEDWALLHAVRELLDLPLNLMTHSAAHTPNWDMVSDMVNSVSRIFRGPRQCKIRYESIIVPREEGRISLDGTGTPPLPNVMLPVAGGGGANKNKKGQKNQKSGLKAPIIPSLKPKAQGTSVKYNQDNNRTYSNLMSTRFANIKAVANKRTPTTKPLMLNPATSKSSNNAQVLADAGIGYETPLSPIRVAANRADRIAKEKQRAHDQQITQQQRLAAQNAASAAQQHAAATANRQASASAVSAAIVPTPSAHSIATAVVQQHQQQQQQQTQQPQSMASAAGTQAVVVGISQPTPGNVGGQQVIVGSPATLSRLQAQKQVPHSQAQTQQQQQQQVADIAARAVASGAVTSQPQGNTVIVSSNMLVTSQQPSVVSVAGQLQLQNPQKINQAIGAIPRVVNQAGATAITPQQLALLKQKTLQKQQQQQQQLQQQMNRQTVAATGGIPAGTTVLGATTSTGQKVSVAVTPGANIGTVTAGNVAVSSVAGSMNAVTVVTQALTGTSKGQIIRQLSAGGNKNIRPLNESELKLIMTTKQQLQQGATGKAQLTSIAVPAGHSGQLTAQLLQQHGIQIQPSATAGGQQVATLVKTVTANSQQQQPQGHPAGGVVQQQNIIPVNMNLPAGAMKAISGRQVAAGSQQQMQLLRGQVFQQRGGAKAGVVAGAVAGQPKVALSQVGGKGVPAQLIVSSGGIGGQKGQLPQAVTVQQIQQIVKQPGGIQQINAAQGLMPHAVLAKQGGHGGVVGTQAGSTVQARVIPVSSTTGGRTQHIQVVTASSASSPAVVATLANRVNAGNAGTAVTRTAAPNVTIGTSGLPTVTNSQLQNALTSNIRVTTSGGVAGQQFLNQVSYVGATGQPLSVAVRAPIGMATQQAQQTGQQQQQQQQKLHVVTASQPSTSSAGQQQQQQSQQQQKDAGK